MSIWPGHILLPHKGKKVFLFGCMLGIIVFFLMHFPSSILANTKQKPAPKTIKLQQEEISALEKTIDILSDDKARKNIIVDLKTLLDAKKSLAQKSEAVQLKPKKQTINLIHFYERVSNRLSATVISFKKTFSSLPTGYAQIKVFFSKKENLYRLFDIGIKFFIFMGISAFFLFFFRKLVSRWRESYQKKKTFSFFEKIETLLSNIFLESYHLAILFFLSWLFLKSILQQQLASAIVYALGAWFIYLVIKNLVRLLLFPVDSRDRLFRLDEQLANYILIWCNRVLLFSLWLFILGKPFSLYGIKQVSAILQSIYRIGLLVMLVIILAQWKGGIKKKFTLTVKEGDGVWKVKYKSIFNQLAGTITFIFIFYLSAIVFTYVLGYKKMYQFFLYATLKSILLIGAAIFVSFLWGAVFRKLFAVSAEIKGRYPSSEEQVNQYVNLIDRLAHFIIIIITLFFLVNIWVFDIFGLLSSYSTYLFRVARIPLIILMAIILIQVITFLIRKTIEHISASRIEKEGIPAYEVEKQMTTLGGILHKSLLIAVWLITGMMVLKELGFSIGPLLAGAGIVGLAVGFGAQNLVRDVISGLFIILENQVRVGDVAILNGTGGLVEQVNLRTTVLRGLDATVHIFPNGSINTISNMTHGFSFYLFDIRVSYKEDIDRICSILMKISNQIIQEEPYKSAILEPLEILGVDKFADSAIIIKARIKTKPIQQWMVGREMNRRIKKGFDEEGVEIPFPHRTYTFGKASNPVDINIKGWESYSSEIKDFIRKIIKETLGT